MPSFAKQGQGFADTASVKGWALQAPAELNLAGSFMWQQIKQWQQRWSPAAHRTSASMGTRPLSCLGWCRLHAVHGVLEMTSGTSKSRAKLEGQVRSMILHDRHRNTDQLKRQRGCRGKSSWEVPSWNLQSSLQVQGRKADESKSRLEEGSEASIG